MRFINQLDLEGFVKRVAGSRVENATKKKLYDEK